MGREVEEVSGEGDIALDESESLDVLLRIEGSEEDLDGERDEYEGVAPVIAEELELPDPEDDDASLPLPIQPDEFTCSRCFLVLHHTCLYKKNGVVTDYCQDCA